jgi:hypothetical protein
MTMSRKVGGGWTAGVIVLVAAVPVGAQNAQQIRGQRYQIGVMESVLEQAVEHGVDNTRERMQKAMPQAELLLATRTRVRGFRQEGYGVFFDVEVPTLDTSLPWSLTVLDQNGLGLDSALNSLREVVQKSGDTNLDQALRRIELQLGPVTVQSALTQLAQQGARNAVGSAAVATGDTRPVQAPPVTNVDAYLREVHDSMRKEVSDALIDAMLDHSSGLDIGPDEWLHIAAKRSEDRPRLGSVDTNADTIHIRVQGADLTEFLARKITREEAIKRVEVKVN